ncbi:amidohydrolase family protein [Daejeonella lutea]|uniref:Cytosine/adenosine deaminase n=1 Tax=Daejeonella lutea TaxID=572036 RepID=A0A1T5E6X7_9SPHI|nr:amidohydrolase family protein [Daejeonella lutea]SKB79674.1 Cytosine/adenosine deaminase [Daejeonella lutea]
MIKYVSADYIFPINAPPLKNGIVSFDERGEILNLYEKANAEINGPVERLEGVIVPGFINSHCHLELSHMKGKVAPGSGLIPFLTNVITHRSSEEKEILEAMKDADQVMQQNGIVAVGDISNNLLSKNIKKESYIHYHTFVEFLGFEPKNAESIYKKAIALLRDFSPSPASLAPHAPYSVSKDLLKLFQKNSEGRSELTSMHNQESDDENQLFRYKTGKFLDFYKALNINIDFFKPQARNSIQSVIPIFAPQQRILLVHNTYTSLKDIYFANRFNRDIHWCFCPKANIYIEGRLPKIEIFQFHDFNITVGTDSLASNDKLCILSELKMIKQHFPSLAFPDILRWATINGARFLGIDNKYGSIEQGKKPGLNLITNTDGLEITSQSEVRRIV